MGNKSDHDALIELATTVEFQQKTIDSCVAANQSLNAELQEAKADIKVLKFVLKCCGPVLVVLIEEAVRHLFSK